MIKAIFFDTSDTLYHNPEFEEAQKKQPIKQLSEKKDIALEEAKELFNKTKEKLKETTGHVTKVATMMELGISRVDMQNYLAKLNPTEFLEKDEKLISIIDNLSNKFKLGIITNINNKLLFKTLDAIGLLKENFDYIVSVDNTETSKPNDEPFQKAIELADVTPSECVYIGDSLTKDIIPAKKNGMNTILISKEEVSDTNVDVIINSIYDIEKGIIQLK